MRLIYILVFLLFNQFIYSQTNSLEIVYSIINKIENNEKMSLCEISLLIESYNNPCWKNDVELSECRSNAIVDILEDDYNINIFLSAIGKKGKDVNHVLDDIIHPIHDDINRDKIINNLKNTKNNKKVKKMLLKALKHK